MRPFGKGSLAWLELGSCTRHSKFSTIIWFQSRRKYGEADPDGGSPKGKSSLRRQTARQSLLRTTGSCPQNLTVDMFVKLRFMRTNYLTSAFSAASQELAERDSVKRTRNARGA